MSGPPPCRFFARGQCRYGQNCRFSHGTPISNYGYQSFAQPQQQHTSPIIGASHFGNPGGGGGFDQNQNPQKLQENMNLLEASIQKDMKDWDEENIWRISCYGPTGGKPCLPGFEDLSEDEIRYETLMNGGVIPPHLCLPDRIDRIAQMKYKWSLPSVENRNILVDLINFIPDESSTPFMPGGPKPIGSIFGGTTAPAATSAPTQSPFGGSSIFGGSSALATTAPATQSPFGGSSIFGGGASAVPQQQQPAAGSFLGTGSSFSSGGSAFGGSTFGSMQLQAPAPAPAPASAPFSFSLPAQNQAPSMGMVAPQQQQQGATNFSFTLPQAPTAPNVGFGAGTPFAQPPPNVNVGFAQPQQPQPPAFSSGTTNTFPNQTQSNNNNIFGNSAAQLQQQEQSTPGPGFGQAALQQSIVLSEFDLLNYSRVDDLSPEELKAFEAANFDEFFPMKLPPKHLCL